MRPNFSMFKAANLMTFLCFATLMITTSQQLSNNLGDGAVDANVCDFYLLQFFSLTFIITFTVNRQ